MDDNRPDEEMIRDDDAKVERRFFLQSLGKWSSAAIAAAVGGVWLPPGANAAWINRRGGGGGWVNRAGWVNGGGGWTNRAGAGGAWVNRRCGGGNWVNRR